MQLFPTVFTETKKDECELVDSVNNMPRKSPGYRIPYEVFKCCTFNLKLILYPGNPKSIDM